MKTLGIIAAAALASSAHAANVELTGLTQAGALGLGAWDGKLSYTPRNDSSGTLRIELHNALSRSTNATAAGGRITGFAFNHDPAFANLSIALLGASLPFVDVFGQTFDSFGTFASGAAMGVTWPARQNAGGIAPGGVGLFVFSVAGPGAGTLTSNSFLTGPNAFNFVVGFEGFAQDGQDLVPGAPAPSTGLAILALAGLSAARRRR